MIWSAAGPSPTARAVGAALSQFMRPDGMAFTNPDQAAIGVRAGFSACTVRKALIELEHGNWVGVGRETFRGGDQGQAWRKNTYWLTLPKGEEPPSLPLPEGEEECSGKVRNILPDTTKSNYKIVYTPEFEKAWDTYPRKVGKSAANTAWKATRRRGVDSEILLLTTSRYAAVCSSQRTEQRYIKHAKSFFGPDEPWRDYMDEPADQHNNDVAQSRDELDAIMNSQVSGE